MAASLCPAVPEVGRASCYKRAAVRPWFVAGSFVRTLLSLSSRSSFGVNVFMVELDVASGLVPVWTARLIFAESVRVVGYTRRSTYCT